MQIRILVLAEAREWKTRTQVCAFHEALEGQHDYQMGKRRWQIEGWFKTAKHRFSLDRFAQGTLTGVYRWLVLSMIAYLLAHWAYLTTAMSGLPEWGQAARLAMELWFPHLLVMTLIADVEQLRPRMQQLGLDLHLSWCKI